MEADAHPVSAPPDLRVRPFRTDSLPVPREKPPELALPVDLEIGCGVGLHPITYCTRHPERTLVAIEHTRQKFEKFRGRIANHPPLPNLVAVHANAVSWVTHYLPSESVERCFILYPNPNPKKTHRNRRWYAMPFMHALKERLVPGGELTLATNERWYAEEAEAFLIETFGLELIEKSRPVQGRTHFERKFLREGVRCYDLRFRKPGARSQD